MGVSREGMCAVLLLTLSIPLFGQSAQNAPAAPAERSSPQAPAESAPAQPTPPAAYSGRRARQRLCWREAGIAPALVNQHWKIEDSAKGQITAVCTDSSLSAAQRQQKIREINAQTEQEIAKIIPAKQLEAFKACQAEQDKENAKRVGKTGQKELGPCGGIIPPPAAAPEHMHE